MLYENTLSYYKSHEIALSWQVSIYNMLNEIINNISNYKKHNYISNSQMFLACWFTTIIAIIKDNYKNCITFICYFFLIHNLT